MKNRHGDKVAAYELNNLKQVVPEKEWSRLVDLGNRSLSDYMHIARRIRDITKVRHIYLQTDDKDVWDQCQVIIFP